MWGFWSLAEKKATLGANLTTIQIIYLTILSLFIPLYYFFGEKFNQGKFSIPSLETFGWIAGAAVTGMAASVFYLMALQKHPSAASITSIGSMYPIITLILCRVYLGDTVSVKQMIGIALSIVAVVLLA